MVIDLFADKNKPREFDKELLKEAKNIGFQIENAVSQFNFITDSQEIEAVIYRMKALETQYSIILKKAKLNKNCNKRTVDLKKL